MTKKLTAIIVVYVVSLFFSLAAQAAPKISCRRAFDSVSARLLAMGATYEELSLFGEAEPEKILLPAPPCVMDPFAIETDPKAANSFCQPEPE